MAVRRAKLFGGWQEFIREFLIVLLGVLAALLAQQAVETLNWRQKVRSAISDMDQELSSGDGPQAFVRLSIHRCLADRLQRLRSLVEAGNRPAIVEAIGDIQLPLRTYDAYAREAATSADIAAHMPGRRMYDYRIVYALIPELDMIHRKELDDLAALRSLPASGGALSPSEKQPILAAIENLMIDNERMKRASIFTLRRMRELGIGIDRAQLIRNHADLPVYRGCAVSNISSMLRFTPAAGGGPLR
jgi:hypothetical protein